MRSGKSPKKQLVATVYPNGRSACFQGECSVERGRGYRCNGGEQRRFDWYAVRIGKSERRYVAAACVVVKSGERSPVRNQRPVAG
ncbi:hypothetical protein [Rhizohabitans arisaemae]|uniref:hypothetical protein n=1 Tax=Rhizohabitans arisaemae TaxID=2720610 RepID=UPI0024B16E93|nr:hypothetical protein [Rhizohabitans arisaemae]